MDTEIITEYRNNDWDGIKGQEPMMPNPFPQIIVRPRRGESSFAHPHPPTINPGLMPPWGTDGIRLR